LDYEIAAVILTALVALQASATPPKKSHPKEPSVKIFSLLGVTMSWQVIPCS
jgi:hypothetical protein